MLGTGSGCSEVFSKSCAPLAAAAGQANAGCFPVRDEEAVVVGLLLQQVEGQAWEPLSERRLDQFHSLVRKDAPEAGGPAPFTADAPLQEFGGDGIFGAEEFDPTVTNDSQIRFEHV